MKYFIPLFLLLFSVGLHAQNEVDVRLDAPDSVVAGQDFEVILTFNKGELKDYSRFSQDLPSGFTASNISSPNADFTFLDQRVRIIWLKLPAEQEVVVTYAIHPHKRISGTLELDGTFAFVVDGERAYTNLSEPTLVKVLPNPEVDPSMVVAIKDFNSITLPGGSNPVNQGGAVGEFAKVVRQAPVVESNGIAYVTVLLKKPEGTNFLKFEESIPSGYTYENLQGAGGVFSQSAGMARYVWMKPPDSEVITLKYRLVPILEEDQAPLVMNGELTYTENGVSKTERAREMKLNIDVLSYAQKSAFMKNGAYPDEVAGDKEASNGSNRTTTVKSASPSNSGEDKEISAQKSSQAAAASSRRVEKVAGIPDTMIASLEGASGLYFRVQVAAVRKPVFARAFFSDYALLRDVKVEISEGWNKYTVGPVDSYKDAQALKQQIISKTPIDNAFIVAYRDGKRVPVNSVR